MFRFTIRDLLWLMVVVGILLGWQNENRIAKATRLAFERRENEMKNVLVEKDAAHRRLSKAYSEQRVLSDFHERMLRDLPSSVGVKWPSHPTHPPFESVTDDP